MAFDCLHFGGRDPRVPTSRKVLEDLVDGHELIYAARRLDGDGLASWATKLRPGYEGLVAKDEHAPSTRRDRRGSR